MPAPVPTGFDGGCGQGVSVLVAEGRGGGGELDRLVPVVFLGRPSAERPDVLDRLFCPGEVVGLAVLHHFGAEVAVDSLGVAGDVVQYIAVHDLHMVWLVSVALSGYFDEVSAVLDELQVDDALVGLADLADLVFFLLGLNQFFVVVVGLRIEDVGQVFYSLGEFFYIVLQLLIADWGDEVQFGSPVLLGFSLVLSGCRCPVPASGFLGPVRGAGGRVFGYRRSLGDV